jgi:hypothetical protein
MAKAQISFPDGTTVKLEGTPDEISAVVDRGRKTQQTRRRRAAGKDKSRSKPQLVDHIANLIDGGFFKKPKDLAAVKGALEEMGHHYPVTTLSPTMLRQVRSRHLRRLKQNKRWMYTG